MAGWINIEWLRCIKMINEYDSLSFEIHFLQRTYLAYAHTLFKTNTSVLGSITKVLHYYPSSPGHFCCRYCQLSGVWRLIITVYPGSANKRLITWKVKYSVSYSLRNALDSKQAIKSNPRENGNNAFLQRFSETALSKLRSILAFSLLSNWTILASSVSN